MDIIQKEFRDNRLTEECTQKMVVLIPKGNWEFREIGLVELIRKALLGVVNRRIGVAVQFHDMLHGFRDGQGKGNVYLESNLIYQITAMREEVLYEVLLDLRKAYDALYRERCMEIMAGYRIGLQTERIIKFYWEDLPIVEIAGQYYGAPFKGHQGATQGDTLSPTIFNMVVDAVIHHWVTLVEGEDAGTEVFRQVIQWLAVLFYTENGLLNSPRPARLQEALENLTRLFDRVGFQTNVKKRWGWYARHVILMVGT